MMIRSLTISVLFAVLALPAYAQDSTPATPQDNPQTRQTDEDEDAYRRSQRRRDTGDIFEDIDINRRSTGGGGQQVGPEIKAIDRLDPESRRHLNKQRAKALAEAAPGEPIDAAYEPSEAAKTDEYIAKQEQRAWKEMIREANGDTGIIQGPQGGQGGQGQPGQGQGQGQGQQGQGQQGQGQGGQQSGQDSGQSREPSVLRGGSASSASAILDQLKGRAGGGGSSPQGQPGGGQGQSPQGQGQSQTPGQGQGQGQSQTPGQGQGQGQSQTPGQGQGNQDGQDPFGQGQQGGGSSTSTASILDQILGRSGGGGTSPQGQQTGQGTQPGQGSQSGQGQSGQGQPGQGTQQVQGPLGQPPGQDQGQGQDGSTQRGGSATSASAILNQIRGFGGGAQQGDAPSETPTQVSSQNQTSQSGQNPAQGQSQSQSQSQSPQGQAQSPSSSGAEASDADAQARAEAARAAAEAAARDRTFNPLEITRDEIDREETGGRTSASDFIIRGK